MHQPSVTDYFKVKKRLREDSAKSKSSKVFALSNSPPAQVFQLSSGSSKKSTPVRISKNVVASSSSECVLSSSILDEDQEDMALESNSEQGRKKIIGKRRVPCFEKYHHLITQTNKVQDTEKLDLGQSNLEISTSCKNSTKIDDNSSMFIPTLPLPLKYRRLLDIFRSVDTVSAILFNRNEAITFSKIQSAANQLIRHTNFRQRHLAQFLTVIPDCYALKYEKMKINGNSEALYQLVLTPNLKIPTCEELNGEHENNKKMTAVLLTARLKAFEQALLRITFHQHEKFLCNLENPISLPPGKRLTRWHPQFKLDSVPDVVLAKIPLPPNDSRTSAKEFIAKAQTTMESANPKMKLALKSLLKTSTSATLSPTSSPSKDISSTEKTVHADSEKIQLEVPVTSSSDKFAAKRLAILKAKQKLQQKTANNIRLVGSLDQVALSSDQNQSPQKVEKPLVHDNEKADKQLITDEPRKVERGNQLNKKAIAALKGVSQSLLDKIRIREQEKSIRSMTLTPEESLKRKMSSRFPEFIKIIRNTVVAEKKTSLALNILVERIAHSYNKMFTESEVETHIRHLQKAVPEWLTILKTSHGEFVKIVKEANINSLIVKVENMNKVN